MSFFTKTATHQVVNSGILTSCVFVPDAINKGVFTWPDVTSIFPVNSNHRSSATIPVHQYDLASNIGSIPDQEALTSDFEKLSFSRKSIALEVLRDLILGKHLKIKEDGKAPESYLMVAENSGLFVHFSGLGHWFVYAKKDFNAHMASLGGHNKLLSPV